MPLDLPDDTVTIGRIEIAVILKPGGAIGFSYGLEDVQPAAAVGYLAIVKNRIEEEVSYQWDTCPACGDPLDEHGAHDGDEFEYGLPEDEDDEDDEE